MESMTFPTLSKVARNSLNCSTVSSSTTGEGSPFASVTSKLNVIYGEKMLLHKLELTATPILHLRLLSFPYRMRAN